MNDHQAPDNNLDLGSYDGIYRQHSAAAAKVANTVATSSVEAQDLVYEAFARLLVHLRDYGAPDVGAEDYLRVVIRRLALNRHPDAAAQGAIIVPEVDDQLTATADQNVIRGAFEALSDDWQQVLWHHEVERKSQLALSQGLQMSASEVASLVFQAREGLRQAYTATCLSASADPECAAYIPNIAIYVKGGMPSRMTRELIRHLDDCSSCTAYRDGYRYLVTNLRETLVTALLMPGGPAAEPMPAPAPAVPVPGDEDALAVGNLAADDLTADAAPDAAAPDGALPDHAVPDDAAADDAAPDPADTDETIPGVRLHPQVAPIASHRERRSRRALAGVVTAAAASAIAAVLVLSSSSPEGGSTSAAATPGGDGTGNGEGQVVDGRLDPVQARVDDRRSPDSTASPGPTVVTPWPTPDDSPDASGTPGIPGIPGTPSPSDRPSPSEKPGAAPQITAHPHDVIAAPGDTATFAVQASGEPQPNVQWQQNGGSGWSAVGGATSPTLSVNVADSSYDGRQYRAVVTNPAGTSTSAAAAISVQYAPQVTANPSSTTTEAGGSATFTASVDAKPDVTSVQWQVLAPGSSWRNAGSAPPGSSSQFTVSGATAEMDGNQYRAVFTNSRGTATTGAATLTVTSPSPSPSETDGG